MVCEISHITKFGWQYLVLYDPGVYWQPFAVIVVVITIVQRWLLYVYFGVGSLYYRRCKRVDTVIKMICPPVKFLFSTCDTKVLNQIPVMKIKWPCLILEISAPGKTCIILKRRPGPSPNITAVFPGMGIPMLKIRRSPDRFIFNMGIPILVRWHLYSETASWIQSVPGETNVCPVNLGIINAIIVRLAVQTI